MICKLNRRIEEIKELIDGKDSFIIGMNDEYICVEAGLSHQNIEMFLLPLNDANKFYYWEKIQGADEQITIWYNDSGGFDESYWDFEYISIKESKELRDTYN